MKAVAGRFQHGASSKVEVAYVTLEPEQDDVQVHNEAGGLLLNVSYRQCKSAAPIPGLPVALVFANGAKFTPDDLAHVWPNTSKASSFLYRLEKHWPYVLISVLLFGVIAYGSMTSGVQWVAKQAVKVLPESINQDLGEQTLYGLDRAFFDPSELPSDVKQQIVERWQLILQQLELPADEFQLVFRKWPLGPNAFALSDGTVIVTDGIVQLMERDLTMLDAVLLHEIGHVKYEHTLQKVVHGSLTTAAFTLVLGDIEGLGDMVLGAGFSVLNNAYSRDMEREADEYAYTQLAAIGRLPTDLSRGLSLLSQYRHVDGSDEDDSEQWFSTYFATHPATEERVRTAEEKAHNAH